MKYLIVSVALSAMLVLSIAACKPKEQTPPPTETTAPATTNAPAANAPDTNAPAQ